MKRQFMLYLCVASFIYASCQQVDEGADVPANLADTDPCNDTDTDFESLDTLVAEMLNTTASFEAACPGVSLPTISGWSADDWYAHCGTCASSEAMGGYAWTSCKWKQVQARWDDPCAASEKIDEWCKTMLTFPCDFTL